MDNRFRRLGRSGTRADLAGMLENKPSQRDFHRHPCFPDRMGSATIEVADGQKPGAKLNRNLSKMCSARPAQVAIQALGCLLRDSQC